ncbi:hypothetical protein [Streptomyces mirabilis]|uniref:hypothetical protein n=1 Tax=Streptomyces mirabilis TaxID=68239 RepID=UPI00341E3A23
MSVDRVVVTLVVLRFRLPHQALTELHDTSRSAAAYMGGLFAYAETYDSSRRRSQRWITVKHAIAEPRQRRSLQGWLGRQESLPEVVAATGGVVSDRAARHAILRRPSTALVLAGPAAR